MYLSILSILFNKSGVIGIPVSTLLAKQGEEGSSDSSPRPKSKANFLIIFFPIFAKINGWFTFASFAASKPGL